MNMKLYEVQQAYVVAAKAELKGLTTDEKYKLIKNVRELKSKVNDFEEFIKDTQEKVTNVEEQNAILNKEATKDVEVNIEKMGEAFDKMLENNEWNATQASLMMDLFK